ncbi:MAG: tripartite tricarboxylate transporter TctB family protein [Eubacteriales bacterium]
MVIRYRANLMAGIFVLILSAAVFLVIPNQIKTESSATYGINSRTLPYGFAGLIGVCGLGLIFQSVVRKQDKIEEIRLKEEAKALAYIACLALYGAGFSHSFLIATCLLGVVTLAFQNCRVISYYLITIATSVAIYYIFTELLHVRLP